MGNRYFAELPDHVRFTQTWGNKPGLGRYWKRLLSKGRRRFAKRLCREGERAYGHMRGLPGIEREVNWKTW